MSVLTELIQEREHWAHGHHHTWIRSQPLRGLFRMLLIALLLAALHQNRDSVRQVARWSLHTIGRALQTVGSAVARVS